MAGQREFRTLLVACGVDGPESCLFIIKTLLYGKNVGRFSQTSKSQRWKLCHYDIAVATAITIQLHDNLHTKVWPQILTILVVSLESW